MQNSLKNETGNLRNKYEICMRSSKCTLWLYWVESILQKMNVKFLLLG